MTEVTSVLHFPNGRFITLGRPGPTRFSIKPSKTKFLTMGIESCMFLEPIEEGLFVFEEGRKERKFRRVCVMYGRYFPDVLHVFLQQEVRI